MSTNPSSHPDIVMDAVLGEMESKVDSLRKAFLAWKAEKTAEAENVRIAQRNLARIRVSPQNKLEALLDTEREEIRECPQTMSELWTMYDGSVRDILLKLGQNPGTEVTWVQQERLAGLMTGVTRL